MKTILGKKKETWLQEFPLLREVTELKETVYINDAVVNTAHTITDSLSLKDIEDAEARLLRFAPYLQKAFPETMASKGIIESELVEVAHMKKWLEESLGKELQGKLYVKKDSHLPISGSVKARGGIYEVLKLAEDIAVKEGLLSYDDNYEILADQKFRELFGQYSVAVGSTGNLGLSIGIMSAKLGFNVTVHMSADAKQWKKDLLREKGATVVEYKDDYSKAVEEGRKQCEGNPKAYFVDDENSQTLFLGYAVAALRLREQLKKAGITVNKTHPLFVYLPCGVGGAPGGITFGMRTIFGSDVHCFMVEPTHSPAMMLGLMTKLHEKVSAQDFGIDNKTAADGLAVGRPSGFVGKTLEHDISGVMTVEDDSLYRWLYQMVEQEGIYLEPSALAGIKGYLDICTDEAGQSYLADNEVLTHMADSTHIMWATGGGMVPQDIMHEFYETGRNM